MDYFYRKFLYTISWDSYLLWISDLRFRRKKHKLWRKIVKQRARCRRSDVSDESLLRRRLPDLRHRRAQIPRIRSRRPSRPDDLRLSTYDQMHFLQVRRQWGGWKARRRLYTAFKRRQREDLCFPLVLVPFPRRAQFLYGFV